MRLWQWYILPGDPGLHPPPGPEIIPRDSSRTNVEISFFIRDIALLSLVAGLSVAISYGKRWMQAENMRKEVESDSMISCETVNSCSTEKTFGSHFYRERQCLCGGRGYDIFYNGRKIIHQPYVPAIPGNNPFPDRRSARKTGMYVMSKIRSGSSPAVSAEEIEDFMPKSRR